MKESAQSKQNIKHLSFHNLSVKLHELRPEFMVELRLNISPPPRLLLYHVTFFIKGQIYRRVHPCAASCPVIFLTILQQRCT